MGQVATTRQLVAEKLPLMNLTGQSHKGVINNKCITVVNLSGFPLASQSSGDAFESWNVQNKLHMIYPQTMASIVFCVFGMFYFQEVT